MEAVNSLSSWNPR